MSRNDENFDFIKQQFDNENVNAPDSLGEAQLLSKILNNDDENKIISIDNSAAKKKRRVRSAVAIAAAFAVVVSAGFAYPYLRDKNPQPVDEIGVVEDETGVDLAHFTSHREINSLINRMYAREKLYDYGLAKNATDYATAEAEGGMGGGDGEEDYGSTYKQVEAVDEADIIKTDGTYIYHYNNSAIQIYAANDGEPYLAGTVESSAFGYYDYSDDVNYDDANYHYSYSHLNEFYLKDGKLIALSQESSGGYNNSNEDVVAQVFDVSDINDIKLIDEYRQSGYYASSRMVGDTLYLVTNHYVGVGNKDFYIPYCGVGEGQYKLDAECIYKTASPSEAGYLVVGAVDTENGVQNTDTKAIFGASSTVYCNENNMYITNAQGMYTYYSGYQSEYEGKIQIIKAALSEDSIEFTAAGFVEGFVNDQFSMDEKDGCLRIATTTYGRNDDSQTNHLFVLDENLKVIGSLNNFANDESIRAVRFVGDMAYVITYEYVDPLFIIDLSNKEKPTIKGSVEIDGFSSLLAPIDENHLLGIGYSTYEGDYGMVTDGLKVVLFDISNPEEPQVLDYAEFYDASSEAQYNHKALVQNAAEGYFAIPIQRSAYYTNDDGDYDYYDYGTGVLVIQPQGDTLGFYDDFSVDDSDTEEWCTPRCTYVGNYIYLIDRAGNIHAYDFTAETDAVG